MNNWRLRDLLSEQDDKNWGDNVINQLMTAGMSPVEATKKMSALRQCAQVLALDHGLATDVEAVTHFIPGRIEVVGKHTDYGGGRSILCAVERGFSIVATARSDDLIRMTAVQMNATTEFKLSPDLVPEMGAWAGYPKTVARRLARNFPSARTGANIAFISDLPQASGMSSSSAMVVAMFLVLAQINEVAKTQEYRENIIVPEDLAGYLGTNENGQTFKHLIGDRGVGTFGGSEDHTAILLSHPDKLVQYAYCPVRHERTIDFPADHIFAIASSGVISEKTGAAMASYNRVSLLVRAIVTEWNRSTGRSDATLAVAIARGGIDEVRNILSRIAHPEFRPDELLDRLEQFHAENQEIVPQFADAVSHKDWTSLGRITDRSQKLSETKLKNQVPQTVELTRAARDLGAIAASAFGAGFGGSVWAIVPVHSAQDFLIEWKNRYAKNYAIEAARSTFFVTRPGPAAFRID